LANHLNPSARSEKDADLQTDHPAIRAPDAMPPLLQRISERKPESLDYLGVSYGLTPPLLRCAVLLTPKTRLEGDDQHNDISIETGSGNAQALYPSTFGKPSLSLRVNIHA